VLYLQVFFSLYKDSSTHIAVPICNLLIILALDRFLKFQCEPFDITWQFNYTS
jgi:hypothetical protein